MSDDFFLAFFRVATVVSLVLVIVIALFHFRPGGRTSLLKLSVSALALSLAGLLLSTATTKTP